jgi:hypothetical protein
VFISNLETQRREHIYDGVEFISQAFHNRTALTIGTLLYRRALVPSLVGKGTVFDEPAVFESLYPGIEFFR